MTSEAHDDREFHAGEWLRGEGPDADIALCTRVRLARNVRGHTFSTRIDGDEAGDLERSLAASLADFVPPGAAGPLTRIDLGETEELGRLVLVERHLISRELADADRPRSALVDPDESVSIMIGEEDHVRTQLFGSGFCVDAVFERARQLDEALIQRVPFAFSEELGFLTTCPTNAGTGMRVSVMLHLPGLVWADEIEKATNTCQKIHLAVRGLYGEGSRAIGDFYQVSNQVTLGRTEEQILSDVKSAVERLIRWEREVRGALLKGDPQGKTLDRVHRALGTLRTARILSSEECLACLSAVRFGVQQGLLDGPSIPKLNQLLLLSQPAHLQRVFNQELEPAERDLHRANIVRDVVCGRVDGAEADPDA